MNHRSQRLIVIQGPHLSTLAREGANYARVKITLKLAKLGPRLAALIINAW